MFLKKEEIEYVVKRVLEQEGLADADKLTRTIMAALVKLQKLKAKKGFTAAKDGGKLCHRPKKPINFDIVKKQKAAGVPLTSIAASQHVSEQTLRNRLNEADD